MNSYVVRVPITACAEVFVEAESKEEAIQKAFEEVTLDDIEEWDAHREVCEGNVCRAVLSRIEVY